MDNSSYSNQPGIVRLIIYRWRVLALFIFLILIVALISNFGFLEIEVDSTQDEVGVVISNDETDFQISTEGRTIKKLLRRGDYEVAAYGENTSSLNTTEVAGFFTTNKILLPLEAESSRQFLAPNFKPCTELVEKTIVMLGCGSALSAASFVSPTSIRLPSFAKSASAVSSVGSEILGSIKTNSGKTFVLVNEHDDEGIHSVVYEVGESGFKNKVKIEEFGDSHSLLIEGYEDGYILYSLPLAKAFYYKNGGKPVDLVIPKPKNDKLSLGALTTNNRVLVATFVSGEALETSADYTTNKLESEVVLTVGGEAKHYSLSGAARNSVYCGEEYVCILFSNQIKIFNTNGKELKLVSRIANVADMAYVNEKLYLFNERGVLQFDPPSRTGHYVYTFGFYGYCGHTLRRNSFLICIEHQGHKFAMNILDSPLSGLGIDTVVLRLLDNPAVKNLSVGPKYIWISHNFGTTLKDNSLFPNIHELEAAYKSTEEIVNHDDISDSFKFIYTYQSYIDRFID